MWGGVKHRRFLVRRTGVDVAPTIYAGVRVLPGYRSIELAFTPETAIVHHWMTGYRAFLAKHRRYVRVAAEDRCARRRDDRVPRDRAAAVDGASTRAS